MVCDPSISDQISDFFITLLERNKIQIVVAVAQKGTRIAKSFKRYMSDKNIEFVSDRGMGKVDFTGKNVLIFDDSVKSGQTIDGVYRHILTRNSAKIVVACLVTNRKAATNFKEKYHPAEIIPMKAPFEEYEPVFETKDELRKFNLGEGLKKYQSVYYTWVILPYICKLEHDSPAASESIRLKTARTDPLIIATAIYECLIEREGGWMVPQRVNGAYDSHNYEFAIVGCIDVTKYVPKSVSTKEYKLLNKIRIKIVHVCKDVTKIVITPILMPKSDIRDLLIRRFGEGILKHWDELSENKGFILNVLNMLEVGDEFSIDLSNLYLEQNRERIFDCLMEFGVKEDDEL